MMKSRIRVSIGIPTYNQAEYLEETILSVLNQTVPAYEIVVSNNHSTDDTEKILEKYSDVIRVVRPPAHLPMVENWNFLVRHLAGEWVSILSSDDTYLPNFIQLVTDNITANAVLVHCKFNLIDRKSKIIEKDKCAKFLWRVTPFPSNLIEEISANKLSFAAYSIKRAALEKIGYFDERVILDSDWATWCKISCLGDFVFVPSTGANYRYQYRENIQIKRLEQETLDQAIIINSIIGDIFKKHKLDLKLYELAKGIYLNHRLKLYKKNKIDYSDMLELYNIDISMMQKYGFWSRLILYIRERILKR